MGNAFGRNTAQVERLLEKLRELPATDWCLLAAAHAGAASEDAAEEALAGVLRAEGLRDGWFELRALATPVARKAAADYAAQTGESVRTIEHVAAVNAWDGQHEASKVEVLGPAHEQDFIDAACGALGVVVTQPYIGAGEFARFWAPYDALLGRP